MNLRKLAIGGTIALTILLVLSSQSKRSVDSSNSFTTVNEVAALFYAQGESLATFEASRGIKNILGCVMFSLSFPGHRFFIIIWLQMDILCVIMIHHSHFI